MRIFQNLVPRTSCLATLELWMWYLFVATAAWQTRLILWQADTRFIEWRAASLYASDVLVAVLFILAIVRAKGWFVRRPVEARGPVEGRGPNGALRPLGFTGMDTADWLLGFFVAVAVLSLAHADQLTVGIYQLLRLAQGILFYLYLRHWAWNHFDADRTAVAFVAGALLQATLGITQYVFQHDAGLRWLGESLLRTDMRGVAVFYDAHYIKILRAYGTFPHPNVLAAYLMMALWMTGWLWMRHGDAKLATRHSPLATLWYLVWPATTALLLWALYLTFSRTVIAVWLAASVAIALVLVIRRISGRWPNINEVRRRALSMAVTVFAVSACFVVFSWPTVVARMTISASDEAVRLRIKYNDDAVASGAGLSSWRINWTGVGIGNFTTWLSRYDSSMPSFMYQPAHNIYLMIYSETGLLGLLLWLAWLVFVIRTTWRSHSTQPVVRMGVLALLGVVLIIGLLDHFYWTLQQGRLLWWATLAIAAGIANRGGSV